MAFGSINAPSGCIEPFCAVSGSIGVDADQDNVFLAKGGAVGVYAACTLSQGDIRFFWNKELGIVAPVPKIQDYAFCDVAIEFVFEEAAVRTAFAGSVGAVCRFSLYPIKLHLILRISCVTSVQYHLCSLKQATRLLHPL